MNHNDLKKSYDAVGEKFYNSTDFNYNNIKSSRDLFTNESLLERVPVTKKLEVFALVSGLPFSENTIHNLTQIQSDITKIIGHKLHYWVKKLNFGVEYCVFKWPNNSWNHSFDNIIKTNIADLNESIFTFEIRGIQINNDGCVIAKGYDNNHSIFKIRNFFKSNIDFLPKKQSGWADVPLGRILEPLGVNRYSKLKKYILNISNNNISSETVDSIKYVQEKQWYMEQKIILLEKKLKT